MARSSVTEVVTAHAFGDIILSLAVIERQASRTCDADVRHLVRTMDRAICQSAAGNHANAYVMYRIVVMGMACLH